MFFVYLYLVRMVRMLTWSMAETKVFFCSKLLFVEIHGKLSDKQTY